MKQKYFTFEEYKLNQKGQPDRQREGSSNLYTTNQDEQYSLIQPQKDKVTTSWK